MYISLCILNTRSDSNFWTNKNSRSIISYSSWITFSFIYNMKKNLPLWHWIGRSCFLQKLMASLNYIFVSFQSKNQILHPFKHFLFWVFLGKKFPFFPFLTTSRLLQLQTLRLQQGNNKLKLKKHVRRGQKRNRKRFHKRRN